ncbi:MAG: phosphoribosylformylglycinamidine synthase, partial [Candidatus Aminicenantes bacterium]|nr:phosphoribosylformylglycinamidine synthase [Candidatus Aminicenantes bacterium]
GESLGEIGGTEYLKTIHGLEAGAPPAIDLEQEKRNQEFVLDAIEAGLVRSAHDLSEGGLAVALAECAFHSGRMTGCEIELAGGLRDDGLLFGESQSRLLVTCRRADLARLLEMAAARGVPAGVIGRAGGTDIAVRRAGRDILRVPVERAFRAWKDSLPGYFRVKA